MNQIKIDIEIISKWDKKKYNDHILKNEITIPYYELITYKNKFLGDLLDEITELIDLPRLRNVSNWVEFYVRYFSYIGKGIGILSFYPENVSEGKKLKIRCFRIDLENESFHEIKCK